MVIAIWGPDSSVCNSINQVPLSPDIKDHCQLLAMLLNIYKGCNKRKFAHALY